LDLIDEIVEPRSRGNLADQLSRSGVALTPGTGTGTGTGTGRGRVRVRQPFRDVAAANRSR
jgi:hypothetical protein